MKCQICGIETRNVAVTIEGSYAVCSFCLKDYDEHSPFLSSRQRKAWKMVKAIKVTEVICRRGDDKLDEDL